MLDREVVERLAARAAREFGLVVAGDTLSELLRVYRAWLDGAHGEAEYITDSLLYVRGKDVGAVHDDKDKWDEKVSIRLVRDGDSGEGES